MEDLSTKLKEAFIDGFENIRESGLCNLNSMRALKMRSRGDAYELFAYSAGEVACIYLAPFVFTYDYIKNKNP
jgi:hypothetical protein